MSHFTKCILVIFSIFFIFTLYQMHNKTATIMKYFPIDERNSIIDATTKLVYNDKQHVTEWTVASTSNESAYLRQDVSLLYENGVFKGMQNKWENNSATIHQEESIPFMEDALLQSVSFHHGEIHHDDNITSVQAMTDASLYVVKSEKKIDAFHEPKTKQEKALTKKIDHQTKEVLQSYLVDMLDYYNVNSDEYSILPLSKLGGNSNFPPFSSDNDMHSKVLGQFWEGFYSNYITLLMSYEKDIPSHFMPFILIAKDDSHLLVLYELEQEKYKLIQHISPN